jgi:anti-anti-sigma factor
LIGAEWFSVEQTGDVTVVRIVDTRFFDTDNYAQFQENLAYFVARQQPRELLVDLSNVVFCSTAFIAALLMAQKCIQTRPGVMKLFGLSESVLQSLQHLNLVGTVFLVCTDEAAARNSQYISGNSA